MTGTNSKICDGSNSYPAHFILKTLCKTIFNSHSLSHSCIGSYIKLNPDTIDQV